MSPELVPMGSQWFLHSQPFQCIFFFFFKILLCQLRHWVAVALLNMMQTQCCHWCFAHANNYSNKHIFCAAASGQERWKIALGKFLGAGFAAMLDGCCKRAGVWDMGLAQQFVLLTVEFTPGVRCCRCVSAKNILCGLFEG